VGSGEFCSPLNGWLGFVGSTAELDLCPLGMPEISPVLRSAVDCYDLECWVDPMGKNLCDRRFCGLQCSSDRDAEDDVVHTGGEFHRKHLECLNRFKFEIFRAFERVKKGWQALGLNPISGHSGYKGSTPKPFKTRKFLMPKKLLLKPKPLSKPTDFLGCRSKPGSGRVDAPFSNPCFGAPLSTPEVVLVPASTRFLPVCSNDDGGSSSQSAGFLKAPSAQVTGSSDVRQAGTSPLDQNTPMDAGVGQSSPVRSVDAGDQSFFLPLDQITSMDAVGSPALVSPEATGRFRYEGTISLAGDGLSVRPCNPLAVVIAQKSSEPLYFYNRKHKVQRASKLDLGQLAGELIRVAPAAVPLVGSQSSVSGGLSGLFAAFEPIGLAGSKMEGSFRASTDGSPNVKPSAQSPPARGLLKRGFLRPSSEKSDLINGYSEVVVSSLEIAQALGISFGDNKKRFLDLMSEIEEGQHRVDGGSVLKPKGWRELKNLECSLNFDVGSIGSSRGKNKTCMRV
jgi:hypothetical protein